LIPELKSALDALRAGIAAAAPAARLQALQQQVDSIDLKLADRHTADVSGPTFAEKLEQSEDFARLLRNRKGGGTD
jgi:hypothetical protein